jgi:hypothetical protein
MRRSRLLLALPAATALVFTGIAPASAGDDHPKHDNGGDAWAEILEIDDEAELRRGGDRLEVRFEYKCDDDGEDVTADVRARNERKDIRYEANGVDLDCDKDDITVTLEKKDEEAEEGDRVDVRVTINANGDQLDRETEEDVEVVDDDNGDRRDGDHHHDDDKDHHDPH